MVETMARLVFFRIPSLSTASFSPGVFGVIGSVVMAVGLSAFIHSNVLPGRSFFLVDASLGGETGCHPIPLLTNCPMILFVLLPVNHESKLRHNWTSETPCDPPLVSEWILPVLD